MFSRGAGYYCLQFQWDQLLPFLHKKRTRVFRDDSLFPGVLIIFNSHVGHEEKLENNSKLHLLPFFFLSFSLSTQSMASSMRACLPLRFCAVVGQPGSSLLLEDFVKISHRLGLSLPLFSFQPHPALQHPK